MTDYLLNAVPDHVVLKHLSACDRNVKVEEALLIAHIAAVDERRLYLGLGYGSMLDYCMVELNRSEDSALKRIRVGRAARCFPALFLALAEGRLHLSAVLLLAPHLTPENSGELIAASSRQSRTQIERLLAERFPCPDLPTCIMPELSGESVAPGPPVPCESPAPMDSVEPLASRSRVTPLAPGRVGWQTTVDEETQALFDEFRSLISHIAPSATMADVLKRALTIAVANVKKAKFAVGARGQSKVAVTKGRDIPDPMRREVYERDGGCCAFIGDKGRRCGSTHKVEVDHVVRVAQGGVSTIDNLRLLCRAHNQFEAERLLGREHVRTQRELAQRERARAKAAAMAEKERAAARAKEKKARFDQLVPGLRRLCFSAEQAYQAAERCESIPDAPLEERMKLALSLLTSHLGRRESFAPELPPATVEPSAIQPPDTSTGEPAPAGFA